MIGKVKKVPVLTGMEVMSAPEKSIPFERDEEYWDKVPGRPAEDTAKPHRKTSIDTVFLGFGGSLLIYLWILIELWISIPLKID